MLSVSNLSVQFGKRVLFDEVNTSFVKGNCYGIIGANGAGKSTFLKILSKTFEPNSGNVHLETGKRMSVLEQDHFAFDQKQVLETVIMGNKDLFSIKKEMDDIYANPNFSEKDSDRVGVLQLKYEEMDGWNAESSAAALLSNLDIKEEHHYKNMSELDGVQKVKVLLAQALFGNPDVLVMDEPTNDLDFETIKWLENFISNYDNTVIVVSHDRHFLDSVCTHISDIDFGKINNYSGNYTFWYESSQLALRQKTQQNRKSEEKKKELEDFIARFSANASKSKQATSRKKMLDNLKIEDIKPSSRRYPAVIFTSEREAGDQILSVENLSFSDSTSTLFDKINFNLNKGDKVVLYSKDTRATTAFYQILNSKLIANTGRFDWGITTSQAYLPLDNNSYFDEKISLVDWLRQWSKNDEEREEVFIRGFLGKMIFSGEEALKNCDVLSGGEKVRCMLSRMMMLRSNVLMFDEPTSHLDLESITALNNSIKKFKGNVILSTHDFEFAKSVGNRVIELTPNGVIDRLTTFDSYISDPKIKELRAKLYN
ncbi:ATP-binding cassette domain-containing protein [Flavobacteriaceae bacterium]|jgi:ATPase subunit of ABC transporter with duplicated ATPase domains|nr:ATP-binding cassette domain-containing protein [Flavobacteriaceae bacterium]MDB9853051.1 ATP-binding cassette domain-containing protein [Flavobacteriaceae bacterium]MDB9995182.1 ATP-binding cassette domain-containing protein [Flavobacteriaceae bacterium]MDC0007783.1 ATP-binding cassette domain-containing protein [Flavobacteriaceae bacterium]MDC1456859.1 ATP-binding cassette domain-containing protein [Flavobacteriaceae bacterium]|tara:strand:- start:6 stop:1628 length:1623 start_codon:yes stop_codon:yes gene_type:complete